MVRRGHRILFATIAALIGAAWIAAESRSEAAEPGGQRAAGDAKTGTATNRPDTEAKGSDLKGLSDADLIKEYERAGLALAGTDALPMDIPPETGIRLSPSDPRYHHFREVRHAIFRRGSEIVPGLLESLRREVGIEREKVTWGRRPGFTRDMMDLLVSMSNPRAIFYQPPEELQATMDNPSRLKTAWALLEVIESLEGPGVAFDIAKTFKQRDAHEMLAVLTHCSFLKYDRSPARSAALGLSPECP